MPEPLALGIDIGGTNTAYGFVNRRGEILLKGSVPTTGYEHPQQYMNGVKNELLPLIEKMGKENMVGVGIGAPNGNFFTGEIIFAPNLPWRGVIPMAKMAGEALGMKAVLTNDANAAAIGEMTYGAAKGMKDFILVTLGTGLGSGFVANGQLIYGHDGLAGELGHVIAVRDGRKCNCGRLGCLERYASATGMVISAEEWLSERNDPTILRSHTGKLTAKMIQDAAQSGDAFALELYEYTAKILGQTLADMIAVTSPEAIIFFGGLAKGGDLLLVPVKKHIEENLLNIYKDKVKLILSALPDADAAILGASALAW
jgi:glucokinase